MTRRLILTYVTLTAFALALLAAPLGITFAHRERDRLLFDAEREANSIAATIDDPLESHTALPRQAIADSAQRTGADIVIVDARGNVTVDTANASAVGSNEAAAKDFAAALKGTRTFGRGELRPKDSVVEYATVPTTSEGVVNGAVRIAYPTTTLDERVRDMWEQLALLCLAVLASVALAGWALARGITRPLRKLEHATDQLGQGDLTARLDDTDGPKELRRVASTFNRMASQLSELIDSQSQFVANASHQLRTPLTALRLRLENLEADATTDADRAAIEAAHAEVARMSQLIDGLLVLARDSAHTDLVRPIDVAAIARAIGSRGGWTLPENATSTWRSMHPKRRGRLPFRAQPSKCSTI